MLETAIPPTKFIQFEIIPLDPGRVAVALHSFAEQTLKFRTVPLFHEVEVEVQDFPLMLVLINLWRLVRKLLVCIWNINTRNSES